MNVKDPEFGAAGDATGDDASAIQDAINWATQFAGVRPVVVEDCRIVRGGTASLELHHTSVSQVRNCFIGGDGPCQGAGILLDASADNHIVCNQITTGSVYESPSQGGPGIEVRAAANVIEGNMVFWCDREIESHNPLQTVVGNRVEMNMGSGLYVATGQLDAAGAQAALRHRLPGKLEHQQQRRQRQRLPGHGNCGHAHRPLTKGHTRVGRRSRHHTPGVSEASRHASGFYKRKPLDRVHYVC